MGASGDLAPLAHMSGAICGFDEAEMIYKGRRMPARAALKKAGLSETFELSAKDASALINGSTVSLALGVLALEDAKRILKTADIALALSLECLRGELAAFDPRVHKARPHPGQAATARNLLKIAGDSKRCSEAARLTVYPEESRAPGVVPPPRVQDVYSLRCAPQVHGPVRDGLAYVGQVMGREINSATDNPLIFADGGAMSASRPGTSTGSTWRRSWTCWRWRWRIWARSPSAGWRASSTPPCPTGCRATCWPARRD